MTYGHAWLVWRILALVLIAIYCIAGTIGVLAAFGSSRDTALWVGFLLGGAALIVFRLWFLSDVSRPTSAASISIGAAAGGLPLFWTLIVPLAAAVLIALASRSRAGPRRPRSVRHTRHGWWLEEAGEVVPTRRSRATASADVVIVGGGYLGLWTAWQLLELEPTLDVLVLEAEVCGHGPSGRNGGFCETLWPDAATLRERAGDEPPSPSAAHPRTRFAGSAPGARRKGSTPGTAPRPCSGWRPRSRRSTPGLRSCAQPASSAHPRKSSRSAQTRSARAVTRRSSSAAPASG